MPSLEELEMDPASEAAFRRGFFHGVQTALNVVGARLNEADRRKLKEWTNTILEWRGPHGTEKFEVPRAPDLG
jgi:hypothetical protein